MAKEKVKNQAYSTEQKLIIATVVFVVLIFLFPPWEIKRGSDPFYPVGVYFILDPPVANPNSRHFSRIDHKRIRLHYFTLFATSGLIWLFIRSRNPHTKNKKFTFE